ncbi:Mth938-like domain-containing protein [Sphingomonas sp. DT-51]|uniref:Mth938-like domain-containing protein n=1 Tax=Sphingomonas sp. DT-51 TaxID=3396165 RepID=UPI003F1CDA7C
MPVRPSPRINHLSWGAIEAEGLPRARDLKLYPGGGREWDWRETGTRHEPGIQPADVQELIDNGSEVVVLSRGMHLRLKTAPETLAMLARAAIAVHVLETSAAVDLYNTLALDSAVGALLHSTC